MTTNLTLNDGAQCPWYAFGTGTALYQKDAAQQVKMAIDNGVIHLDGAQMYENEQSLGQGIIAADKPRSELFVTTKLAPGKGPTIRDTLLESLKKLRLDYVDLFLIHSPKPFNQQPGGLKKAWKEMEDLQKEGLTKSIGVSNFRVEDLKEVLDGATVVPAVNQIEFHPYVYKAAKPIADLCEQHKITIASYGGLTPLFREPDGPVTSVVNGVAEKLSKATGEQISAGQVLTKWILQKGAIVVSTTSKASRIKETFQVETLQDLTSEDIAAIDEAGSKLHHRVFMKDVFGE